MTNAATRHVSPQLALAREQPARSEPRVGFCSHCGSSPDSEIETRVCESCSLGLILHCDAPYAPRAGSAFIVIDDSMAVCAVSAAAERLLATREPNAVNRHVTELLVPADAEATGRSNLAVAITMSARGDADSYAVVVRPANTFGVRLSARISSCGPPTAALVVFE